MNAVPAIDSGATFYVATNGNDAWSGRLATPNAAHTNGPFATFARARDAVRALKQAHNGALPRPVTVLARGGTYFLPEPFTLSPEDSGSAAAPVVYAASRGEHPMLSGGRRLSNWQPATVAGRHLWTTGIPAVRDGRWIFRELWVDGKRRTRARHPQRGYLKVAGPALPGEWDQGQNSFPFSAGELKAWPSADQAEVVVMTRWVESRLPIERVDEAKGVVSFRKKSVFHLDPGDPYYVENALELLDTPGEWYLDRRSGTLYYMPTPEEAAQLRSGRLEVIAPFASQVVRLEGRPESGQIVEGITLRGFTFSHTTWSMPESSEVGGFGQAAVGVPGAVYGEGVRHVAFENCRFTRLGTSGLELARGCQDNRIAHCDFSDLGAGGIKIGEPTIRQNAAEQTRANEISDCRIQDGGRLFHSAVGIWIGQSADNRVLHNEIHNFLYTGISVGWTWGYGASLASGNRVEFNDVHHIGIRSDGDGPILSDMGGIYTLGLRGNTVIRSNVFHDVAGIKYGGWGIYFDEGTSDALAENNLVYRTTYGGFHQHYGKENVVRNNVFAFGRDAQVQATRPEPHRRFTFGRNIVYWRDGALFAGDLSDFHFAFDRNCYWHEGGGEIRFSGLSFSEWQSHGMDPRSVIADPLFENAKKNDFRLRPDSPALKLGFVPLDLRTVGVRPGKM